MSVDPKLLEILVCPVDKTPLEVVELPEAVRRRLADRYRDQFKGEEPVVEIGLASPAGRVYPVVSGIPVMLVDDALSRESRWHAAMLRGSQLAIEEAQLSSARYYQRPDNDYSTFDPTRTPKTIDFTPTEGDAAGQLQAARARHSAVDQGHGNAEQISVLEGC